jgi:FAD/FMN-containing dehydrogenase
MVDCAAHRDLRDELLGLLAGEQGVMALGPQRDLLYKIRDHVTIAIGALGVPLKLDVAVPVQHLDRLMRRIVAAVPGGARLVVFGHLAEGNLHVNVLGAGQAAAGVARPCCRGDRLGGRSAPSTASASPRPTGWNA